MKTRKWLFFIGMCGVLYTACAGDKEQDTEKDKGVSVVLLDNTTNDVTTMTLKKQGFSHELISNGKVTARRTAELRFESNEIVTDVYVKNGDRVYKDQKLAVLDTFKLHNELLQAQDALTKAKLDLQDVLIGLGYPVDKQNEVPTEIMKLARVKSGYDQSQIQYESAKRALEHATLVAPFDGVVANLFTKPYNYPNTSESFCSIIDMHHMEVDFMVLESELSLIKEGDRVLITPYSNTSVTYKGRVSEVNPVVNEDGLVKVKAVVENDGALFNGMNVKISVRRTVANQLVIPKSAVVLRTGREVVFTLKDNKAMWNYVNTGLENSDSCIVSNKADEGVTDGLLEGDTVIVTGNVNLAHETPVKVAAK